MNGVDEKAIGMAAGKVWDLLTEMGELSISRIISSLDEQPALVSMAVGWLAREGRLNFRKAQKRGTLVSLK